MSKPWFSPALKYIRGISSLCWLPARGCFHPGWIFVWVWGGGQDQFVSSQNDQAGVSGDHTLNNT